MTVFPTFEEVYPGVQQELKKAKQLRSKQKGKIIRYVVIGIIMWAAVLVSALMKASGSVTGTILFIVFISSFALFGLMVRSVRDFHYSYKKTVVDAVLQEMFRLIEAPKDEEDYKYRVTYKPTDYINGSDISKGIMTRFVKTRGEDYTRGQIGLTTFKFSEVELIDETTTTNDKDEEEVKDVTVFKGVAFIADFHKDFDGKTYLFNKRLNRSDKLRLKKRKAFDIELEDMAFNKAFKTMTTNDIEARYILSSNLMERIVAFKNRAHGPVQISFVNSNMYIFTETKKDLFEARFWRSNDEKALRNIYDEFMTYFDIVEEFTLNRRIWGKR